jgi:outer membrane lipoprotein-sorting protein
VLRTWRWAVLAFSVAVLVSLPTTVPLVLGAGGSSLTAATLLQKVQESGSVAYSGYAESTGGLALPVTSQFTSVADLFGSQTQMRVWWRSGLEWRVDTISVSGETDVHQVGSDVQTWEYEANQSTWTHQATVPAVRLPVAADLLPTTLASRLLSEATAAEVSRLPTRRIAGRDAVGLRLKPAQAASTIDQVDVWVDLSSGLALRVEVYGGGTEVVSTQFLDFSTSRPSETVVAFTPPSGARVRQSTDADIAAAIDRLGNTRPPSTLAGIARNDALPAVGAIGVYGKGVTEFAATPLPRRTADGLRSQLAKTPGVVSDANGLSGSIGPLTLVLTPDTNQPGGGGRFNNTAWLLTGTVDVDTLNRAAAELVAARR